MSTYVRVMCTFRATVQIPDAVHDSMQDEKDWAKKLIVRTLDDIDPSVISPHIVEVQFPKCDWVEWIRDDEALIARSADPDAKEKKKQIQSAKSN